MTTFVYLDFCMTMNTVAAFAEQWQILTHWISTTINRLSDEDLARSIAPNRNHGIWILGHLIQSEDELAVYWGRADFLFPHYNDLFGIGTPLLPVADYPAPGLLRQHWAQINERNRQAIATFTDAEWDEPHALISPQNPIEKDFFKTKGRTFLFWNLHQTLHLGQLNVLMNKKSKT
ncbi:MAG: DinB family protein [Sphingobacteriales bacterium]|nr:DinB family protein [Sphingobacteriales bacterium]